MAIRKSNSIDSSSSLSRIKDEVRKRAKNRMRNMLLEELENRQLLTAGPQLIGIQPNNSDLLVDGQVRSQSPRELVFRFDDVQQIHASTLGGIRISSAGGDGSFGLATAQSDFGSNGGANIQLSAVQGGQTFNVAVTHVSLPAGAAPAISLSGNTVSISLNTNPAGPNTAAQLIDAINSSAALSGKLTASLNGGLSTAILGQAAVGTYSPFGVTSTHDSIVTPGAILVGANPDENEVTYRFAEALKDDNYRIEVFGFDDPVAGITGLRNANDDGSVGELFRPSLTGTRKDTLDFRLDLGPKVLSVVPQPVVRVGGQLEQQRDTIVVYFDNDKLLVENDASGAPTSRSVENPAFYQLIYTADTVRNTDDSVVLPTSVKYNAATNTATLKFSTDLNDLFPGPITYRLRIGTRETAPTAPKVSVASATVVTDLNTAGAVKLRFTDRRTGESHGDNTQVRFIRSGSGNPTVSVSSRLITVDLGAATTTARQVVDAVRASAEANALVSVVIESGSGATVVGGTNLSFSPVTLVGLGDTFDTALDLGVVGSNSVELTSLILSSSIDPQGYVLDLPGASDDAAHRDLPQNSATAFENHVNSAFGADSDPGITQIFYNFKDAYASGQTNAISEDEKARTREVLSLWSKYIGVQFTESADQGLTFANGTLAGVDDGSGLQVQLEPNNSFGVRIDPSFANPLVVMSSARDWNAEYGQDFTRTMAAAVGMVLGLEHAGDLPESTLLRLDPTFLAGSGPLVDPNDAQLNASDERFEPIVPGNQDILHGRFLHRPDSSDIDLYRFEVDFGGDDRVGILTAETYAQRLQNASELNTNIELFREKQASATTSLGAGASLQLRFEAVNPGSQGNQLRVFFTQTDRGNASKPTVTVFPNAISIDLNATTGSESTVQDVIDAVNQSAAAAKLVKASLLSGDASQAIGNNLLTQNPVVLNGGGFELVSQNDDYFSRDSFLSQSLTSGVYYLGVSASGNDEYNAALPNTGFGGTSDGAYDLRITFRAAVDTSGTIQDIVGSQPGGIAVGLDGDADGTPGGNYDFWFETRPLNRTLRFNAGGSAAPEGRTISLVGSNGATRVFEFSADASISAGRIRVPYSPGSTAGELATALATAINGQSILGINAVANGAQVSITGERTITVDPALNILEVGGKTIFVDKSAGPNADGTLAKPFNNIAGTGQANAFASALPGDIVRIVGNGGADGNAATLADSFAYEIGTGLLAGTTLTDGATMNIPAGVVTMIDANAVFKLRRARIGVGSTNLNIDRSGAALQVLGTPLMLDANGNALRSPTNDPIPGSVYFTSWLDESIGLDNYAPRTTPNPGDWGGISFRRDLDQSAGRRDLEDEGLFLQHVNFADIRYGGGTVIVDSQQTSINPIQMLDTRPTITNNRISFAANAAMSALPNSFEETNFHEPRYQANGLFTSDYQRVGPEIHGNTLVNNSINGLFIRVDTPVDGSTQTLTVPGRFDDIDVVHVITENIIVSGSAGGSIIDSTKPEVDLVSTAPAVGGTLSPGGTYNYRLTFVDRNGYESLPSDPTSDLVLSASSDAIRVAGLPSATGDYVRRRLYRSDASGVGPYELVANLDRATSTFLDLGMNLGGELVEPTASGVNRARLNASLVIDPGAVLKLEASRIEATFGANILAEGTDGLPITFTSRLDDTIGAGGTFDTNNNGSANRPLPRDWGGIFMAPTSTLSLDHARLSYAGGVTKLESTFRAFNTIELQQAQARIANTVFESNADGFGGQGPGTRFGRLSNEPATIFARGVQPIIINNTFRGNVGSAITIDLNSMTDEIIGDRGRQTGDADLDPSYAANRGPLIRNNRMVNNDLNGLKIRAADILTTASVWDDTDITHVVYEEIFTGNIQHNGGLRLQSAPNESLVVKFEGYGSNYNENLGAGLTAYGDLGTSTDRVGGTLHLIGQPGFPVILTSLFDDSVGAGLRPDGNPQNDTNNDGIGSIPQAADWRGILLDQFSNDRNVALVLETEGFAAAAPGPNASPNTAQVLGSLAANGQSSSENQRLGFIVEGVLSQNEDIDVYSFSGVAGTEVWLDVDYTETTSDLVLELLDANGNLLARSDNSTAESADPSLLFTSSLMPAGSVNPLQSPTSVSRLTAAGAAKEDGTTNPLDPGMRVRLPGSPGTRSTFFFRIRSSAADIENIAAGRSKGVYQVQVRMREAQEWAGSSINYADIRYATNGVRTIGLPSEGPLLGEVQEDESVRNGSIFANNDVAEGQFVPAFTNPFGIDAGDYAVTGNRPQYIGNLLNSAKGGISVAGELTRSTSPFLPADQVDFYLLEVRQENLVSAASGFASVVFDLDYADGLSRPDTSINIFQEVTPGVYPTIAPTYRLVYSGDGSNIADDLAPPLSSSDASDLSRGSFGTRDGYIGPVALREGNYVIGISSAGFQPLAKLSPQSQLRPISAIRRIADTGWSDTNRTTFEPPVVQDFLPRNTVGASELVSATFNLGGYSAADLPGLYLDYTANSTDFEVFVELADGTQQKIASTSDTTVTALQATGGSTKVPLQSFAGQDGLKLVFRSSNTTSSVDNLVIGFAERGEAVSAAVGTTYRPVTVPAGTVTTGRYQLEVRLADEFFETQGNSTAFTHTFDTNDRLAAGLTLTAPAGADLQDGDRFSITDGGNTITFEFSLDSSVGLGNIPVRFNASDPAHVIARQIRNAINNPNVQSRLKVQAATSSGFATGAAGRDVQVNLHGKAEFRTIAAANPAGQIRVSAFSGSSDSNITREQSQVIIQNSFIRESRDYGVFSQPAQRMEDPRNPAIPGLVQALKTVGTQAQRNLVLPNDSVQGGLTPGIVVQNNVLEEGGLGGVFVQGENPIWMISPSRIPHFIEDADDDDSANWESDFNPFINSDGSNDPVSHFGSFIDDGDLLTIDVDRTRVRLEFEDLAGGPAGNPVAGSAQVEGDGVALDSSVAWYRDTGGDFYQRLDPNPFAPFATNAWETVHALRDSILSSILVSNGTTQTITATVADSMDGPYRFAPLDPFDLGVFSSYPTYYNRAALYLEGPTTLEWADVPGGFSNPFEIRQLDLGEVPQPLAKIVNNTIIGTDGRASFNGEDPINEANDTIKDAVQTWQGTAHNPLIYSGVGVIGDGGTPQVFTAGSANGSGSTGGNGNTGTGTSNSFAGDRLILSFVEGVSEARQAEILRNNNLTIARRFDFINALLVETNTSDTVPNKIRDLSALPEVKYAEPDYRATLDEVPNDPLFVDQWGFDNQGQTGGRVDADIDLPEAWDTFSGSEEVVIAVIDSGVDYRHPDLARNMWVNPGEIAGDGIDNDGNGYIDDVFGIDPADGDSDPMDINGHGTHVAGTTSAVGNNDTGVAGVNENAKIMALKIGIGGTPAVSFAAAIESLQYLVTMKTQFGINIVVSNNSYGGPGFSQAFFDAIQASIDVGISFVASAGNSGTNNDVTPHFPDGFNIDEIISVAATDHNDQLAGFSQFGATTVDIGAPGVDILSTTLGGGYGLNSGTSMASPHVAGVVALLAGAVPDASVSALRAAIMVGADPLQNLDGVVVSGARLNAANALRVLTSGLAGALSSTDVDIYQFKLGVGERAIVDIDTAGSGLDSILQIFDSRGVPQPFQNASGAIQLISDNDAAPNETLALDPYADFTATAPGVYYAAVSSAGNDSYDPLSLANRKAGNSTGPYRISISARHLQNFVITAEDASAYNNGDTFTIFGVPDIGSTGSPGQTFEFVIGPGGPSNPNNIPINLDPGWRFPDVAVAITKAVNEGGAGRGPAITNEQRLRNGDFGVASPLPPVYAQAIGGVQNVLHAPFNDLEGDPAFLIEALGQVSGLGLDQFPDREIERILSGPYFEVNKGLELFVRRNDGFRVFTTTAIPDGTFTHVTSLSHMGIGHDRESTIPISFTSQADGGAEKFVQIRNAAWIQGNGAIRVDPDENANNNLDQLLPETGVLASRGASPTVLNNVFFNLQTPLINEESRINENTGAKEPYGTDNPNVVTKPGQVIVGGSIYQYYETGASSTRFATGIETTPTNVPNTALDLNFDIANGVRLFENAQAGIYLPAAGSPLIDSAIDTLPDRPAYVTAKSAVGVPNNPVVATDFDLYGQLRTDDPDVSPPGGVGQNVFKDRGAIDRADTIGPAAILLDPIDNDSLGIDRDPTDSVVQLNSGVYPEFRIQLADGNEPSNPLFGLGIDDNTVVGSAIANQRLEGAAIVVFENGVELLEGIDYKFAYNSTRDEIILTPLAGVWKNGSVYEISINNRDRFVLTAPSGDQVSDGESFTIIDENGGVVVYEFDIGYRLQVPQGLEMQIPLAGGSTGGISDGDRFTILSNNTRFTFEFDLNGNVLGSNIAIPFALGDSQESIRDAVVAAIQASAAPVTPMLHAADNGRIFLGAAAGVGLDTSASVIDQPATTLALRIPAIGPRPGGITEGQFFTISDGLRTLTFEYDADGSVTPGRVPIDYSGAATADELAVVTQQALAISPLTLNPVLVSSQLIHLGLGPQGSVDTGSSRLSLQGIARTLRNGETISITTAAGSRTFEFTTTGSVASGNIAVPVAQNDSQDVIGDRLATAIREAGLGLLPRHFGDGNIAVGGSVNDTIDVSNAPNVGLFGTPGVASNTRLEVFGPLLLQVPTRGASDVVENSTFSISNNGLTVVFEFDGDLSGPSAPNNRLITFSALSSASDIAATIAASITASGLGIAATAQGGQVNLGTIQQDQVVLGTTGMSLSRGVVSDGEVLVISNGTATVSFEFDDADLSNGFAPGNTRILFSSSDSPEDVIQSMKAAIEGSPLGLTTTTLPGGILELNATSRFVIDSSRAPTLIQSGVPGGANAISYVQSGAFTAADMKQAIIAAINATSNSTLGATERGSSTLFVTGARVISPEISSFFIRGVADIAGNFLKANQVDDETEFTILMPGVVLDYGDAPDPVSATQGRYPTQHVNNGARHVVGRTAILGNTISSEPDGLPTPSADGDTSDDGVVFGANFDTPGIFNRNIQTSVTITLASPGFVDGWIDFNFDGDWDDPGEQILSSASFSGEDLTRTFQVTVPATAPVPASLTSTFARFRSSSSGGLTPTGLSVDGEVEDYQVTIAPGVPPTAVNNVYLVDEDTQLVTTDPTGRVTPGFAGDDGIAANDTDPNGGTFGVTLVTGPAHAANFTLTADGTFTYRPAANFFGQDTFTYKVNDGVLNSNNIGTVTITVREVNDAPIARNVNVTLSEDQVWDVDQSVLLANDSAGPANESGQTLTVLSVDATTARGGTVSLSGGRVVYTPPTDYSGPDSFGYTIIDNGRTSGVAAPLTASAVVNLTIRDKNDAPITGNDSLSTNEDVAGTISVADLLSNDSPGPASESSQTLSFVRVLPQSTNGGSVSVSGGVVTYTPPADFAGTDTFFYEVVDNGFSEGQSDPQTSVGTVMVTVTGVNDAPRVGQTLGQVEMNEDDAPRNFALGGVFTDPDIATDGDSLTYSIVSNSNTSLVTASIVGGQLRVALAPDQNGEALIVVRATDSDGLFTRDTLTLTVAPVNDAPRLAQSIPDQNVNEDATIPGLQLSPTYFFDPDVALNGDSLTFAVVSNSNPLLVTPTITNGVLSLALVANRSGSAVITISATDSTGNTLTDQFTVAVAAVDDVPETQPDSYTVPQGSSLTTTDPLGLIGGSQDDGVLANDSDPEGASIAAVLVRGPSQASSFSLNANGTFTYAHNGSSRTADSFVYRASDGNGVSVDTLVTINIGAPLPPPHQNPVEALDVNTDGFITPIDALLIINFINQNGGGTPVSGLTAPPPYRDVDGNNFISANDVLRIINHLNSNRGNGEGELGGSILAMADNSTPMTPVIVDRVSDNAHIGVRVVEREELIYGPELPLGSSSADYTAQVDLDWTTDRLSNTKSDETQVDLALASLLGELGTDEEA